jgi:heme exporter protein B
MWRDALAVCGKDLRVEWRSRVGTNQILPFALVVLLVFGFALGPDKRVLETVAPGVFWVGVMLASLLAVQRSFSLEAQDGVADGLKLSGMDPAGIFLGKAAAIALQLLVLEVVMAVGVFVLFEANAKDLALLALTVLAATVGVAVTGTVYGVVAAGLRVRETLLPLLLLPVLAPVVLSATKAWQDALAGSAGLAWPWLRLLAVFAVLYLVLGIVSFGPLLEESPT